MADFLTALGIVALVIAVIVVVDVALAMRALVRANRVAPERHSAAPLSWLASPRAPARLHRRLQRAVAVSDFAVDSLAPAAMALRDVAGELVQRAVGIDDWLVAAHRLHPQARRARMAQLGTEVREVEVAAARLHRISADWRQCLDQAAASEGLPLPDMHQRLDAVEAALRELAPPAARRTAGLPTPSV